MDFVFDRTAEGHNIKNLTVVDDATQKAVAILPERALGENQLASSRGLPRAIRTDNSKVFCGWAKLTWDHVRDVQLLLIEPFNGRFRDEYLMSTGSPVSRMPV